MLNKEKIIEIINSSGSYIDKFMLDAFIKNWKIEAIYEDENGVEFFDDDALEKIKSGISPKEYPQDIQHEQIINESSDTTEQQGMPEGENKNAEVEVHYETIDNSQKQEVLEPEKEDNIQQIIPTDNTKNYQETEIKNVTLDITNQTLGMLAESIAGKITADIAKFIKNTDFLQEAMDMGAFKKDNEILAKKVQEIINDNKILVSKIQELEAKEDKYIKVFGNIYVKKN